MKNEERFEELLKEIDRHIDEARKEAESWRAVGKNYSCKKDGKPYASVKRAMQGVTGISGCYSVKGFKETEMFLGNEEGFVIPVTGLSLNEVEEKITETAKEAEERMNVYMLVKKKYVENIEKCDKLLDMYFDIMDQDLEGYSKYNFAFHERIKRYLKDSIDKHEAGIL